MQHTIRSAAAAVFLTLTLAAIGGPASAHGMNVKITDDDSHFTYQTTYSAVTINADNTVSFGSTTVKKGTIVYSDGPGPPITKHKDDFYNYSRIPIDRNDRFFQSNPGFNVVAVRAPVVAPLPAPVVSAPAAVTAPAMPSMPAGSGLIGNDGGGLIGNDGAGLITNDGGSLVATGGGNLVAQGGGNFHTLSGPVIYGQRDVHALHCDSAGDAYVPHVDGVANYYTKFPSKNYTPTNGMYVCVSDAKKIGLTSGGTFTGSTPFVPQTNAYKATSTMDVTRLAPTGFYIVVGNRGYVFSGDQVKVVSGAGGLPTGFSIGATSFAFKLHDPQNAEVTQAGTDITAAGAGTLDGTTIPANNLVTPRGSGLVPISLLGGMISLATQPGAAPAPTPPPVVAKDKYGCTAGNFPIAVFTAQGVYVENYDNVPNLNKGLANSFTCSDALANPTNAAYRGLSLKDANSIPVALQLRPPGTATPPPAAGAKDKYGCTTGNYPVALFSSPELRLDHPYFYGNYAEANNLDLSKASSFRCSDALPPGFYRIQPDAIPVVLQLRPPVAAIATPAPGAPPADSSTAFDRPETAAAFCSANRFGDVVRRDNITTSKLYGKPNYFTYYVMSGQPGYAPSDSTGSGSYYCAKFVQDKGWKVSPQPRP